MNELEQLSLEIERQRILSDLAQHDGWAILRVLLVSTIEVIDKKLLECSEKDLVKLQERHRAFESVLRIVDDSGNLAQHFTEEFIRLEDEENYKKLYALNE